MTNIQAATNRTAEGSQSAASAVARVHEIAIALTDMVRQQQSTTNEISYSIQLAADGTRIVTERMDGLGQEVERSREQANAVLVSAEELSAQAALLDEEVEAFLAGVRAA